MNARETRCLKCSVAKREISKKWNHSTKSKRALSVIRHKFFARNSKAINNMHGSWYKWFRFRETFLKTFLKTKYIYGNYEEMITIKIKLRFFNFYITFSRVFIKKICREIHTQDPREWPRYDPLEINFSNPLVSFSRSLQVRAGVPDPSRDHTRIPAAWTQLWWHSEPVGSVRPKFPTIDDTRGFRTMKDGSVTLLCSAQGFPVPVHK